MMEFFVNENKPSVREDVNDLLTASLAFCSAFEKGPQYASVMTDTSKKAMQLFQKLAVSVRNIQDDQSLSPANNPIVGRRVVGLTEAEAAATLSRQELAKPSNQDAALRDILNRLAHASEDRHGFRVSDGDHFLLIVHKDRSGRNLCATEFKVADFCDACNLVAQ